jgi:thiol-disulfide isomerase/thioredoxin
MKVFVWSLVLMSVGAASLSAQKKQDVVKKVMKATEAFEQYEVKYEKLLKYQSEKDTIREVYHSTVYRTDIEYYIGWHHIFYLKGMTPKSLVSINTKEVARLNFKDNIYYDQRLADDEKKVMATLQSHVFYPWTRYKEDYRDFEMLEPAAGKLYMQKLDTVRDGTKKIRMINRTIITISSETYIPETEESWTWFRNGGLQYSKYRLIDYNMLSKKAYAPVLKTSDSLLRYIKGFVNGGSIREKNKKAYKDIKTGDSAYMFSGITHSSGQVFHLKDVRDSIILLDFFYTTCVPCVSAVPEINKLYLRNKDKGVLMLGVDPFSSDWPNLNELVMEKGLQYPIVKTSQDLVLEYGVTNYPRMLIIKNGVIVRIIYGFSKDLNKSLQADIDALLK